MKARHHSSGYIDCECQPWSKILELTGRSHGQGEPFKSAIAENFHKEISPFDKGPASLGHPRRLTGYQKS